jgi:hypothetical protein
MTNFRKIKTPKSKRRQSAMSMPHAYSIPETTMTPVQIIYNNWVMPCEIWDLLSTASTSSSASLSSVSASTVIYPVSPLTRDNISSLPKTPHKKLRRLFLHKQYTVLDPCQLF